MEEDVMDREVIVISNDFLKCNNTETKRLRVGAKRYVVTCSRPHEWILKPSLLNGTNDDNII